MTFYSPFLHELGLRRYPPLNDIINLCASPDPAVRPIALKYLLDNITTHYKHYDPLNFADIEFIPTTTSMGRLKEVSILDRLVRSPLTLLITRRL
jgi:hypothetical protein